MTADREPPLPGAFPPETLAAFFDAVEINDVVDADVHLPDPIVLDCTDAQIRQCFALCLQFWEDGVHRSDLLALVGALLRDATLPPADIVRYKHIRARYKQLRFALVLYGRRHRVPPLFNATVVVMGQLQDSFRNGQRRAVRGYALVLRALLSRPLWALVRRGVERTRLDTADGFLAYRKGEIRRLEKALAQDMLTGPQFHTLRRIVSRQVSFYDSQRTVRHDDHHYRMSRFLSAINGLMGSRHDEMVEQAMAGTRDYRTPAPLDDDLRQRLELLVARYPL